MLRSKKEVDRHVRELLAKIKNDQDRKSRGFNIARLYFNVGELESARRYLAEFTSLRPRSPEAHRLLGEIYEGMGQKEKAIYSYKTSYEIADTQRDLVLKICELYADINYDNSVRLHWAEEGERLYPHHNSIIKLRESLMLNKSNHSKEDLEKLYLQEIKASPFSLSLHLKLLRLYNEWAKEDKNKLTDAYYYVTRVESRRLFSYSFEWYQCVFNIIEIYETWKKPHRDKRFEELMLSILDRYVSQSLTSCCGSALTATCTVKEAAKKLQRFDDRLITALKIFDRESLCGQHMIKQYYFHLGTLLAIIAKNESVVNKEYLMGVLLIHASEATKNYKVPSNSSEIELIKGFWYNIGCHRVSQCGHILTQMAVSNGGSKKYLDKLNEFCASTDTRKIIHNMLFGPIYSEMDSFLIQDENFGKNLSFVNKNLLLECDQDTSIFYGSDLRELVWLFLQYDSSINASVIDLKPKHSFFNFHIFRGIPFSSNINTNAPETLCHLDLLAFVVATSFCQQANDSNYISATLSPTVLCLHLHTVEQSEWWSAAAALCNNSSSKKLNRLRSVLQNGLEVIRHLSHQVLPLPLTVHLARYFSTSVIKARADGNSVSEIEALEERAEHYWNKVLNKCKKSGNVSFGSTVKSRLFDLPRSDINDNDKDDLEEEGQLFIADRLTSKGHRQEAIEMLSSLKTPRASFKRAKLYKDGAKEIVGNCNMNTLSLDARSEYISLLTQARDSFFLTLDRLKMPGGDPSDSLNYELSEELASIERSLATASLDDAEYDESNEENSSFHQTTLLTNGNGTWGGMQSSHFASTPFRNNSTSRVVRLEARPSPERLDAQVRHLTEIQQNTIKNIEDHNAALRAQNDALLQTCQTMASEFKHNVAFYKSFIEQKMASESLSPIIDQMKELQLGIKGLQGEVRILASEVADLRASNITKSDPPQFSNVTSTPENSASLPVNNSSAIQGVYNNYMGFYGQPTVASPLVAPNALFPSCQPPFLPPTTIQDQSYIPSSPTVVKSEQNLPSSMFSVSNYQSTCNSSIGVMSQTSSLSSNNMKSVQNKGVNIGATPPHSFQITLPSSTALPTCSLSKIDAVVKSSTPTFSTEGLLSTVPAPLYSAVTTHLSPEKGSSKNLLVSSLNYSPVTGSGSITKGLADSSPNKSNIANISDNYVDDGHDPCPDYKPVIPLPATVEVHTGEEDETVMFEERGKLYRYLDKEWKERGIGLLKVLHNTKQGTVRVLMRRDQTLKICCNHLLTPALELNAMKDNDKAWIWAAQDFADEELKTEKFCCRFKTSEIAFAFKIAIDKGKNIMSTDRPKEDTSKNITANQTNKSNQSLLDRFKPDAGSWSCETCLLVNKEVNVVCAACQTLNPSAKSIPQCVTVKEETTTLPFQFGIPSSTESSSSLLNKSSTLSFGTSISTAISFGPSSTVTITPATAPVPSLFYNTDRKDGKFTVDGFTFSATPKLDVTDEDIKSGTTLISQVETKKDSIFSNFSFKASTDSSPNFSFSLPKSSTPSTSGGLFSSANNSGPTLSFDAVASKPADKSIFQTKDDKAFQPKPLFGSISTPDTKNNSVDGDKSKDEVEDYEPQVDFKPVIPLPELIEVKTGEEDEERMFCERGKLYRYDPASKEWKERGIGELKLLKNTQSMKVRILMRREQTHKVCANHFITHDMKLSAMANSETAWVWAANDYADEEVKTEKFAIKFKSQKQAKEFKIAFENAQTNINTSIPVLSLENINKNVDSSKATSLADMFKPTSGSWECSGCLIVNKPDVNICPACSTSKPGYEPKDNSDSTVSSSSHSTFTAKPFSFGSVNSGPFSFGVTDIPKTTATTTFSFGLPSLASGSSLATISNDISTQSTVTTGEVPVPPSITSINSSTTPFSFKWKPAEEPEKTDTVVQTCPPSEKQDFIFGSPGKYEFSFSGVKSPRSRDISLCESEDGVAAEDEEDNLYFEPVVPLPEKIEVVTGEEDETSLFTHRAKLYRISSGEWKERGLGDIKILEHNKTKKIRLLMRREQVLKICLNHNIDKDMEFRKKDDKTFYWVATDFSESEPTKLTFAIRFKTPDIANLFIRAIQDSQKKIGAETSPLKVEEKAVLNQPEDPSMATPKASNFGIFGGVTTTRPSPKVTFSQPNQFSKEIDDASAEIIQVTYEKKASPDLIEKARKLKLPDNFYLYETVEPCSGCIGCDEEDKKAKSAVSTPFSGFGASKDAIQSVKTNLFGTLTSTTTSSNIFLTTTTATTTSTATTSPTTVPTSSIFSIKTQSSIFGSSPLPGSVTISASLFTPPTLEPKPLFGANVIGATLPDNKSSYPVTFGATKPIEPPLFGAKTVEPSLFGIKPVEQSLFGTTKTVEPSLFGATPFDSSSSIFGGKSLFGGKPVENSPSAFPPKTGASNSIFGSKTGETNNSIFGPKTGETNSIVFAPKIEQTNNISTALPSIFGGKLADNSTNIFGSKTGEINVTAPLPSLFGGKPADLSTSLFGPKTVDTNSIFSNAGTNSTLNNSGIDMSKASLLSSPASAISFGDIAKKDSFSFKNSNVGDSSVWVSKPLFVGSPGGGKSLEKDQDQDHDEDYDPHYEPVISMPDLIEIKTGEEGWQELFSQRAKLFRYEVSSKQWKERGIGDFKIQFEPTLKRYRLLQRREQVHKLSCNHYVTSSMELEPMLTSDVSWCWFATDYSESVGESLKLAVRFKTKEIALNFQEVFNSCKQKLVEDPPLPVPPQSAQYGDLNTASFTTPRTDSSNQYEDKEEDEEEDEEETDSEDEDSDDDEEDEPSVLMSEECVMHKMQNNKWQVLGNAELRVYYDDEAYGARIVAITPDEDKISDNLISMQSDMNKETEDEISWKALDELANPPEIVHLKAQFFSTDAAEKFEAAFLEGKEYAFNSGIEETYIREAPDESLLYYGDHESQDPNIDSTSSFQSCDPELTAALDKLLKE